ncbi:hypothetical protein KIN20_001118 [Parelaphostrongylus tenuis]|uniref:Uncharacterized protein n=1 Tax=Parelaphostrongylus tenuis TaxID=148309 RepID=A0AAD5LXL5_PARTN|nr:hypothetical protein KIN20_001118 [Parelaphostrongylus tenuis]
MFEQGSLPRARGLGSVVQASLCAVQHACNPVGQPTGWTSFTSSRNCWQYDFLAADYPELCRVMEFAHLVSEQLATNLLSTGRRSILYVPILFVSPSKSLCTRRSHLQGRAVSENIDFEVNRESGVSNEYRLAVESGPAFDEVPLENAILGCGTHNLHIYDRSIVMGSIPYWHITLEKETFTLKRDDIPDDTSEKCSRFPIAVDSGSRIFARLRDDHSLVVYNPNTSIWTPYYLAAESHLNLDSLRIRGLSETFGRAGHRMGAIESPLSIYSDGSVIIARIKSGFKHYFYRVTFDHERYEFLCERRGWAQFSGGVDRMFYTIVGETSLILIGIRAIAIAPLQPPTLVECALMALQDRYCKKDDSGARMGGLSPEDIKRMVRYRGTSLIPA